jgi:hypothetical protein
MGTQYTKNVFVDALRLLRSAPILASMSEARFGLGIHDSHRTGACPTYAWFVYRWFHPTLYFFR